MGRSMTRVRMSSRATFLAALLSLVASQALAETRIGVAANLSGADSFAGDQIIAGATEAIQAIDGAPPFDGELRLIPVDDNCEAERAPAAAALLIEQNVKVVIGHSCSGPSLAAASIYEDAGVLMISPSATNVRVTEESGPNVFRVIGRDDRQGAVAAEHIATVHQGKSVAVIGDDTAYGSGLAEQTMARLRSLGIEPTFIANVTRHGDFTDVVDQLVKQKIEVVYLGGDAPDAGLILRMANDKGHQLALVSGDTLGTDEFWLVSSVAGNGTRFTFAPDPRKNSSAADVVAAFREAGREPLGYTLHAHAAVSVWAEAVRRAGTMDAEAVASELRSGEFDTVLGRVGFDENGDVEGAETFVMYEWRDGKYFELEGESSEAVR